MSTPISNSHGTELSKIKSTRTRNIVRGILSAKKEQETIRSIARLRRESTSYDLTTAYNVMMHSKFGTDIPLPPIFPESFGDCESAIYIDDKRDLEELCAQTARFAHSEKKLLEAIESLEKINDAIIRKDADQVSTLVHSHVDGFGISEFLLRKALSIRHSPFGQNANAFLDHAIDPYFKPKRTLLGVAFETSIDSERSYIRDRRRFLDYAKGKAVQAQDRALLFDLFSPSIYTSKTPLRPLQAYSRRGVIDSLAFMERLVLDLKDRGFDSLIGRIVDCIPARIHAAWLDAWQDITLSAIVNVLVKDNIWSEYYFFRHCPAWSEVPAVAEYRTRIETVSAQRLDGVFPVTGYEKSILTSPATTVSEFLPVDGNRSMDLPIDPRCCGMFHRSIAFATNYMPASPYRVTDGRELLHFLGATMDIAKLMSIEEIQAILPPRPDDLIYEYLRTALVFDVEEGRVSDHAFRRATQDVVINEFDGSITGFAEFLDDMAPHVANHLFGSCSEVFLNQLFHLYATTDDVLDGQAELLEWYGKSRDDQDSVTRARAHRLNLRLRKVRGTIDDARIYVDQLQFQYWALDAISERLRECAALGVPLVDINGGLPELGNPILAVVDPRTAVFHILDLAYKEFCGNEIYGVDSYIGRRIRHGTLHGVLVGEMNETVRDVCDEFSSSAPNFAKYVSSWHERLSVVVKKFGSEHLQVRSSDKKLGLIVASLDDPNKRHVARNMLDAVAEFLEAERSSGPVIGLIYDFCWLLLEVDLKRLRSTAEGMRRELVISPVSHGSGSSEIDARVRDAIRTLNTELQQKFDILVTWLTRPSNVSPSATLSLLFKAVLEEVRGRYLHFDPIVIEEGDGNIDIFGHRFHSVYDVLFVLVDNAAKHGKEDGEIKFSVPAARHVGDSIEIQIVVSSELKTGVEDESYFSIQCAMNSALDSAMTDEEGSGLRKVRTLVDEVSEFIEFLELRDGNRVSFQLNMSLPLAGPGQGGEIV